MNPVFILSSLLAVVAALPQNIPVVRPNHYLSQGTFQDPDGSKQHLLPQSFFTPAAQQVGAELKTIEAQSTTPQLQQTTLETNVQSQTPSSQQEEGQQQATSGSSSSSSTNTAPDSYSNIGGHSGRGRAAAAAALANAHEYGETVPQAFSNLQQDSYAFYQGHQSN